MTKPSLPQGTRDFGPEVVRKRQYILDTIRSVFERFGFQPLETPAMENLDTLMGKYGEEGDKLIFKILNNGLDHPSKEESARQGFDRLLEGKSTKDLTERALRYDLTIPFARYVAMNHGQLVFPFKRYQVQPVWRADRPQKGRYREFYQCDADVVGSRSLWNEVEFVQIYHEAMIRLGLKGFELRINSRKLLAALADRCGGPDLLTPVTVAIDKLDKIGLEAVREELRGRGLGEDAIAQVDQYLRIEGTNETKLEQLRQLFSGGQKAAEGIEELETVLRRLQETDGTPEELIIDPTLARGLNYYTGIIFEVKAPPSVKIGSIGGGGRYDDLTGLFGVPNLPGAGISFGVDRIYDVLEELKLFPPAVAQSSAVLFFNQGEGEALAAYRLLSGLRQAGLSGELFPEAVKLDRQFKYAERKGIPLVVLLGSRELESGTCSVKHLATGRQDTVPQSELVGFLQETLVVGR